MAGFEEGAIVNLSRKRAVFFAKENLAITGFGFVDFAAGDFSGESLACGTSPREINRRLTSSTGSVSALCPEFCSCIVSKRWRITLRSSFLSGGMMHGTVSS